MTARSIKLMAILGAGILGCDRSSTGPDTSRGPISASPADGCLDLPTAPERDRVDLGTPSFSNPTSVTNPLFPISRLFRLILLGQVEGVPFRAETTLLPETKTIDLDGKPVETLVSQYAAFLDGRIHEVALDFYAQADDGAAWYFGEDVFNYEDGLIADTEGTWLAGRDGPAAMIMPDDRRCRHPQMDPRPDRARRQLRRAAEHRCLAEPGSGRCGGPGSRPGVGCGREPQVRSRRYPPPHAG